MTITRHALFANVGPTIDIEVEARDPVDAKALTTLAHACAGELARVTARPLRVPAKTLEERAIDPAQRKAKA